MIISVLISNTIAGQDLIPDSVVSKMYGSAIYGSVGFGGLWYTATAYYERMFQRNTQKSKISTLVKAGYGDAAYWEDESQYILGQIGILKGFRKHHLEVSAGFIKFLGGYYDPFPLAVSIGYRLQKPGGHFLFRAGMGWPEVLNIGLG